MSENSAHQISFTKKNLEPHSSRVAPRTLSKSRRMLRDRTPASGSGQVKTLAPLGSPEHFVSLPCTKKQPATERSSSCSRLRHWLAPPLLGTHLRKEFLASTYADFFIVGQCILGPDLAQTATGRQIGVPGGTRTCDRRIRSPRNYVPARSDTSAYLRDLQDFYSLRDLDSSAAFQPVPARLQYGCSTSVGSPGSRRCASRVRRAPMFLRVK